MMGAAARGALAASIARSEARRTVGEAGKRCTDRLVVHLARCPGPLVLTERAFMGRERPEEQRAAETTAGSAILTLRGSPRLPPSGEAIGYNLCERALHLLQLGDDVDVLRAAVQAGHALPAAGGVVAGGDELGILPPGTE